MDFSHLALICLVSILGPLLSFTRSVHVPVIIGELAVGFVLGPTALDVVSTADPAFTLLAQIGFVLVMFVAGSHVPVGGSLRLAGSRTAIGRALLVGVLAVPLGLLVAHLAGTGHGPLYAVLIASSSAAVILPALGPTPIRGPVMTRMVPQVVLADAACIVVLPLVVDRAHVLRAGLGALLVIAGAVAVYLLLERIERTGARKTIHDVSGERGLALELRILLTMLLALAALAQAMHVSTMLAGFVLGVAVARVGAPRRVGKQFFALSEGFFGPVFFVWLGAGIDLRALASHPQAILLGLGLAAAALLAHGAAALTHQPLPVSLMTAAQMGVPVAAVAMLEPTGTLAPGEDAAILLGALVTIGVTALLASRVQELAHRPAPPAEVG